MSAGKNRTKILIAFTPSSIIRTAKGRETRKEPERRPQLVNGTLDQQPGVE